jgi:hypothetical protein
VPAIMLGMTSDQYMIASAAALLLLHVDLQVRGAEMSTSAFCQHASSACKIKGTSDRALLEERFSIQGTLN